MKKILKYFAPHNVIARKLKSLEDYADRHGFYFFASQCRTDERKFKNFEP